MSQSNQNNLTVTVASAATSLLLFGMFYPNSAAARRRRQKQIEGDGSFDKNDKDNDGDGSRVVGNGEIDDDSDNKNENALTISSISSSASLSSLKDDNNTHRENQQQQQQQGLINEDPVRVIEKSMPKQTNQRNEINGNNVKIKDIKLAQYGTQSASNQSFHSPYFFRQSRTHSISEDSEDSDLSYADDNLTKSFRHIRRGSINANMALLPDEDISITLEDSEWCDSSSDLLSDSSYAENDCIYLDYNGTTPIHPMVLNAMVPYFTRHFGNPSSSHAYGLVPRAAVGKARRAILYLLHDRSAGAIVGNDNGSSSANANGTIINSTDLRQHKTKKEENSIVFTGCGTEADNLAIRIALELYANDKKKHIITSNVEHPAIDQALKALEAKGECEVTYVPVNKEGIVSAQDIVRAIRPNQTVLVTLMLANNESGALQPVREVSAHCRKHGILFHTDAAQAAGKVSLSFEDGPGQKGIGNNVDMLTIVGHKIGAPKGVAALYIRPGCLDNPAKNNGIANGNKNDSSADCKSGVFSNNAGVLLLGGGQENGLRAGTENVPYIVGMGCAASLLTSKTRSSTSARWEKNAIHMENMRNRLLRNLTDALGKDIVRANGPSDASKRLPNTLSVGLKGIDSAEMLKKLQMHVACSAGSACHAQGGGLSPVLKAMGVPEEFARGTLRLSVGPNTRPEDVDKASKFIVDEARRQFSS